MGFLDRVVGGVLWGFLVGSWVGFLDRVLDGCLGVTWVWSWMGTWLG